MDLSDHVPIQIIIEHKEWKWEELDLQKKVKNKKFMAKVSREVLRRLYLANDLKEIM